MTAMVPWTGMNSSSCLAPSWRWRTAVLTRATWSIWWSPSATSTASRAVTPSTSTVSVPFCRRTWTNSGTPGWSGRGVRASSRHPGTISERVRRRGSA
ncbi:hypothetical protein DPMN_076165 [Dreissena polymorpha]|uniref:Uncharacterized protein n=1 Tax=Dreissena polymorpha TaxID=45954 RepID=A0A9D3YI84_DREPO|nr:hypothetical protein DPMN_076165 [Dreissena polymorpha]